MVDFKNKNRKPSIIIPYTGPCEEDGLEDLFVYLRPESNGFLVESVLLGVIHNHPLCRENCRLVYLANLPGDFIKQRGIIEDHYALKLDFARRGRKAFTETMKELFEKHFAVPFETAEILGAFDVLKRLNISAEELFNLWVEEKDILYIHGQCIKKKDRLFIVNYDIPALLSKYTEETDIAVMIFRITAKILETSLLLKDLETALKDRGILGPQKPASRIFHYSKGPFEQILDALGYLYDPSGSPVPREEISFYSYLTARGVPGSAVLEAVKNPIRIFMNSDGRLEEDNLFIRTYGASYPKAFRIFSSIAAEKQMF